MGLDSKINMAEGEAEGDSEIEIEELQKAIKLNGRYVDPWRNGMMPSKADVFRWRFKEKNERGIGGTWRDFYRFNTEASPVS